MIPSSLPRRNSNDGAPPDSTDDAIEIAAKSINALRRKNRRTFKSLAGLVFLGAVQQGEAPVTPDVAQSGESSQ